MATLRAAELEVLFTANDQEVVAAEKNVKTIGERIEKKPITQKVNADEKGALAGMDRVEQAAKKLVTQNTSIKLDADISRAEKGLERARQKLADLEVRALGGLDVTADVRRAEAALQKTERHLAGLQSARTMIEVDANTIPAEDALNGVSDVAGKSGADSGEKFGAEIITALATIPIAGAIVGVGAAAGKALIDGLRDGVQQEAGYDRLQALTGIDPSDALRLGRAAGEAYANVFGESVEANMDTARLALQFDLIDEGTSTRAAQRTIEGLSGIADVLGEDVQRTATAVTTLLRNGLAPSAQGAFDILAAGARNGLNRNEDLLDTLTEYPVVLTRLGLTGQDMLGLLNQGLESGARNTDVVADALKEFQIRATDSSVLSAEGFKLIGLNAEDMTARVARGGKDARDGLDEVLTGLRNMENPVDRNTAAVALFGTKAEDLGEALFALDLSTAASDFDDLAGSAQRMFDTLADNDATKLEQAQRNIEVATDGMKGALAAAFSEPLGDAAEFISANRGPMLQFFLDLANGALDFGEGLVNSAADGTEAFGAFISGPGVQMLDMLIAIQGFVTPLADQSSLLDLRENMLGFDDASGIAADRIRDKLLPAIDEARDRLNGFGEGAVAMGFLNDASIRLADSLSQVGVDGEGVTSSLEGVDLANLRASESGRTLEGQIRAAAAALADELDAAEKAGEGQELLTDRYDNATEALMIQLTQMGLTQEQAQALIDTVMQTPESATTEFGSNAEDQQAKVQALADRVTTLPDGSILVTANTTIADAAMQAFINRWSGATVNLNATGSGQLGSGILQAQGGLVEFMAQGGLRGLTPMSPVAQVVPPSTWRVVGDRGDVAESYIPLDGSSRSLAILLETMRQMGVTPMAQGGITSAPSGSGVVHQHTWQVQAVAGETPEQLARRVVRLIAEKEREIR